MSSNAEWRLYVRESVVKELSRCPPKDRVRLEHVIAALPQNPYAGDVEKMKGETLIWRRRVGNYRVFYELIPAERTIAVFRVERRTSSTY